LRNRTEQTPGHDAAQSVTDDELQRQDRTNDEDSLERPIDETNDAEQNRKEQKDKKGRREENKKSDE
jgi:hypothetical protein